MKLIFITLVGLTLFTQVFCEEYVDLEYENKFFKILLDNAVAVEEEPLSEETQEEIEEYPAFINGTWFCGHCADVDETRLIYTEVNKADFTYATPPTDIQVQVAAEGMRCVTLSGEDMENLNVQRASGACSGNHALLAVKPRRAEEIAFTVKIYGK